MSRARCRLGAALPTDADETERNHDVVSDVDEVLGFESSAQYLAWQIRCEGGTSFSVSPRPWPAHASISGPEKGGGPTESHAYRDAGGAGPLGGRPFPPSRERRRGACRVRAA